MRGGRLIKQDILGCERTPNGELRLRFGDATTGVGVGPDAALWGQDGFISRPNDPEGAKACQALVHEDGNTRRVVATKDNRCTSFYGQLETGDRAIVSTSDARWLLKNATASIVSYTKTPQGDTCIVSLEGSTGLFTVAIGGPGGTAMFQMKSGEVTLANGAGAAIQMKGNSIALHADTVWVAGGRTCIGVLPGGQAPLPGINSALVGPMGMSGVPSSTCTIAP